MKKMLRVLCALLAALTLFAIPVIGTIIVVIVKKGFPLFEKMQQAIDGLNARVQESTANIRVIKSFVREEHEKSRFYTAVEKLCDVSVKASGLMVTVMPFMQLVMNLTTVAALWIGGGLVQTGELEIGNLMAYNTYIMHILMSMMMMSMTVIMYSRARASSRRLKEVLKEQSTVTDKEDVNYIGYRLRIARTRSTCYNNILQLCSLAGFKWNTG